MTTLKKNKLARYFILVGLLTLITVLFIIIHQSYHNLMGPIRQAQQSDLLRPIDPNLDIDTLKIVEERN